MWYLNKICDIMEQAQSMGACFSVLTGGKEMENIVLIGMPGVGKSTAGVVLAKVLGYRFIDADLLIQQEENRLLHEIIEQEGTEAFLEIENRVNAGIQAEKAVIATGGSVVYGREAMEHLSGIGTVVYLKLPFEKLEKRLHNIKGRGVVLKEGQSLWDLYQERTPLYEKYADLTVEEAHLDVEQTIAVIVKLYRDRNQRKENA